MVQEIPPARAFSPSSTVQDMIRSAQIVVEVSPEREGALEAAVRDAQPDTTIVLKAGTYRLKSTLELSNVRLSIVAERSEGACVACIVGSNADLKKAPLVLVNSKTTSLFMCNIKIQYDSAQAPQLSMESAACLVVSAMAEVRALDCEFTCPNGRGADLKGDSTPIFDKCFFSKCSM